MSIWVVSGNKEKFYSSLTIKKIVIKSMNMFLKFGLHFKLK